MIQERENSKCFITLLFLDAKTIPTYLIGVVFFCRSGICDCFLAIVVRFSVTEPYLLAGRLSVASSMQGRVHLSTNTGQLVMAGGGQSHSIHGPRDVIHYPSPGSEGGLASRPSLPGRETTTRAMFAA